MKVRDSSMPERDYWESLFDVPAVLDELGVDSNIGDVIEVGCGYGTFTIPVARRISGTLHAFDIDAEMIARTKGRTAISNTANVALYQRDVIADGFSRPAYSMDAVLLFNILHAENPVELLRLSADVLQPGGRVLVIHWRSDVPTPRGPDLSIRPRPQQIIEWACAAHMLVPIDAVRVLPPWHFGVVLQRQ